ncbi:MAG: hypothetical protein LYZ69_08905 [Nitrososphaerales archaeon]|nr:hypothetical protein [Nitrososphaerales archaeon]
MRRGDGRIRMNTAWHKTNKMPKRATMEQRLEWHVEHADACGCRQMPARVRAELKRRRVSHPVHPTN